MSDQEFPLGWGENPPATPRVLGAEYEPLIKALNLPPVKMKLSGKNSPEPTLDIMDIPKTHEKLLGKLMWFLGGAGEQETATGLNIRFEGLGTRDNLEWLANSGLNFPSASDFRTRTIDK